MGYIVCDKCGGYYELQPGESPEDFNDKCECEGDLKYVQDLNDVKDTQPNKIESKFRLHPVVSISLGFIVFFILLEITSFGLSSNKEAGGILTIVYVTLGGFVSTYFAREKKMQYGLYLGLVIAVLFSILEYSRGPDHFQFILNGFIKLPLLAGIGGFIGAALDNHIKYM